ncbi:hypothetical protein M5K25_021404 [Dendrobium thyrsiflorum]|uniref:tRNA dimethylallyltransferase 2 n=1 Tax=Dendrobium thyrsiflorum TaxID=117978 RepID=A0ABD0UJP2_DENTH
MMDEMLKKLLEVKATPVTLEARETIVGHGRRGNPNIFRGRKNLEVEILEGEDDMSPVESLSREERSIGIERRVADFSGKREDFYHRGAELKVEEGDLKKEAGLGHLQFEISLVSLGSCGVYRFRRDRSSSRIEDHLYLIHRYLSVYASSGVLPSSLFHGNPAEISCLNFEHYGYAVNVICISVMPGQKWGRADNFRYTCCFIWVDASLPVLDRNINTRVDCMIDAGLLEELSDIYKPKSDYTRGLKQAIGVREFEEFFKVYFLNNEALYTSACNSNNDVPNSVNITHISKPKFADILLSKDSEMRTLLVEAIDKFKANTRKLARRQKRRLNHLKTDFSWNLNYIDVTRAFSDEACDGWSALVLEPCVNIVRTFLLGGAESFTSNETSDDILKRLVSRELCTQYVCEACGNRVLRGTHEWEQHKKGRVHRKRFLRFKKSFSPDQHTDNYADVSKLQIIDFTSPKLST